MVFGDKPYVFARLGVVHGSRTWSETTVSGGGGGGYVYEGTGFTNGVTIKSRVTVMERFVVRHADGTDTPMTVVGSSGFADGQEVALIYGSLQRADYGYLYGVYNVHTEEFTFPRGWMRTIAPRYGRWSLGASALSIVLFRMYALHGTNLPKWSAIFGRTEFWTALGIGTVALSLPLLFLSKLCHYLPLTLALRTRAKRVIRAQLT
ncbi:MAG: hypothetical protein ABI895_26810 [Deltaproteobacteria bacterium]